MGWRWFDKRYPRNHGIGAPEAFEWTNDIIIQKAKYHSSWDSLMPVFSKINTIVKYLQVQVKFFNYDPYYQRICGAILDADITAAHEAIYMFIEWYEEVVQPRNERPPARPPV